MCSEEGQTINLHAAVIEVRAVVARAGEADRLSWYNTGHDQLTMLRSAWREYLSATGVPYRLSSTKLELATFAGTKVNATISELLSPWVKSASGTAFTVTVTLHDKQTVGDVLNIMGKAAGGISAEQQRTMIQNLRPLQLSKYQPFLPTEMATQTVVDYLLDVPGTESYLQSIG